MVGTVFVSLVIEQVPLLLVQTYNRFVFRSNTYRGHDFRPDYNNLRCLRRDYPNVPIMALTATADQKVVNDSIRALGMSNPHQYRSSFNRPNLHYEVRKKDNKTIDEIADYVA